MSPSRLTSFPKSDSRAVVGLEDVVWEKPNINEKIMKMNVKENLKSLKYRHIFLEN